MLGLVLSSTPAGGSLNLKENKPGALSARGVVNLMEKPINLRVKFNSNYYLRLDEQLPGTLRLQGNLMFQNHLKILIY